MQTRKIEKTSLNWWINWILVFSLFLPVLGEYGRLEFLGRSLIVSDLLMPLLIPLLFFIKGKKIKLPKVFGYFVVFCLIASTSLLFAWLSFELNEIINSGLFLLRLVSYSLLVFYSYKVALSENEKWANKMLLAIITSAILIAITGFIQLQILPDLKELAKSHGYDPHINRLVGSWLDPNFIGGFFAFIISFFLPFALSFLSSKQKKTKNTGIIITAILAFLLLALFLTYSRSAYLAMATGLLLFGLIRSRITLIIIICLAIPAVALSPRAQTRLNELRVSIESTLFPSLSLQDPTARLRAQNWQQTWELISQKPLLGHGYNTLALVKLKQGFVSSTSINSASGSDSSLLTIAATTGLIGLSLFLITIASLLRKAWLQISSKASKNTLAYNFSLGYFCALCSLLVHSFFVNSLLFPPIMIFLFISTGIFLGVNNKSSDQKIIL